MYTIKAIYNKLSLSTKSALWFTICSILQKGIAFIATPIYTRLLSEYQYGLFSVFQSWLSIITIFATLCLSAGVFNNLLISKEKYNATDDQILSSIQFLEICI